jgi:hypothetical protein
MDEAAVWRPIDALWQDENDDVVERCPLWYDQV